MAPLKHSRAVLFDLDGTLADTAPDLAAALNATLVHFGRGELPLETIRPVVSHGGVALIRLGFQIEPDHPAFEEKRQYLLHVYLHNICRETTLFEGMDRVLDTLEQHQIAWGIVTNKPSWLTDPLIAAMNLGHRSACIISGDTCSRSKPHPDPILHACRMLAIPPQQTIYVGDAERDMQAGRAARTSTVCALFGYIQETDQPLSWPVDHYIDHATQLLPLIGLDGVESHVQ